MNWINIKKEQPPLNILVLVTNGKDLGYLTFGYFADDDLNGYVSGIPDSKSHQFRGRDISHWCFIELPIDG